MMKGYKVSNQDSSLGVRAPERASFSDVRAFEKSGTPSTPVEKQSSKNLISADVSSSNKKKKLAPSEDLLPADVNSSNKEEKLTPSTPAVENQMGENLISADVSSSNKKKKLAPLRRGSGGVERPTQPRGSSKTAEEIRVSQKRMRKKLRPFSSVDDIRISDTPATNVAEINVANSSLRTARGPWRSPNASASLRLKRDTKKNESNRLYDQMMACFCTTNKFLNARVNNSRENLSIQNEQYQIRPECQNEILLRNNDDRLTWKDASPAKLRMRMEYPQINRIIHQWADEFDACDASGNETLKHLSVTKRWEKNPTDVFSPWQVICYIKDVMNSPEFFQNDIIDPEVYFSDRATHLQELQQQDPTFIPRDSYCFTRDTNREENILMAVFRCYHLCNLEYQILKRGKFVKSSDGQTFEKGDLPREDFLTLFSNFNRTKPQHEKFVQISWASMQTCDVDLRGSYQETEHNLNTEIARLISQTMFQVRRDPLDCFAGTSGDLDFADEPEEVTELRSDDGYSEGE